MDPELLEVLGLMACFAYLIALWLRCMKEDIAEEQEKEDDDNWPYPESYLND